MKALAPTSTGLEREGFGIDFVAEVSSKNDRLRDFQFTTGLYFSRQESPIKTIGLDDVLITLNI